VQIRTAGGFVANSVTTACTILVCNSSTITTKTENARRQGTIIVNEDWLQTRLDRSKGGLGGGGGGGGKRAINSGDEDEYGNEENVPSQKAAAPQKPKKQKLAAAEQEWVGCDLCEKWHPIPFDVYDEEEAFFKNTQLQWTCKQNWYAVSERSEHAVRRPVGATTRYIRISRFAIGSMLPRYATRYCVEVRSEAKGIVIASRFAPRHSFSVPLSFLHLTLFTNNNRWDAGMCYCEGQFEKTKAYKEDI